MHDQYSSKTSGSNILNLPSLDSAIIAAGIGLAGVVGSSVLANNQAKISNRREKWEILFNSLEWFGRDPFLRSTAISVVETKWEYHDDFRKRWASIFISQAIYILKSSANNKNGSELSIEKLNLYRVMNLLTNTKARTDINAVNEENYFSADLTLQELNFMINALKEYKENNNNFLHIGNEVINSWILLLQSYIQMRFSNQAIDVADQQVLKSDWEVIPTSIQNLLLSLAEKYEQLNKK
ncbi:hypothetical protein [Acaryochloris sp. CCMEE 5410]|uniref:hypothetical protein n=1 Tax=Acaryochloris sp. CCMEE 5410 TaxID=310037 RepID=UPI00024842A5|nr:hypothetical protein [Acaryochloris sp. CCMEE 5410]KAI9135134.1 hypothetical protein ON05_019085 [Acaryochloris sp. CCMEE 5410]